MKSPLHGSLVGLALVIVAWVGFSAPAHAATRNYTLYVTAADRTIETQLYPLDRAKDKYSRTFHIWGFSDVSTSPPVIGGIKLVANEGDTVSVTVYNQNNRTHGFAIKGITLNNVNTISYGGVQTYSFIAPAAGDYIYYDPLIDAQTKVPNRAMGLAGALIVYPPGGTPGTSGALWTGGPTYTKDFVWVLSDFDNNNWNGVAKAGGVVNTAKYQPNFTFINNEFGHAALKSSSIAPAPKVGDTVAIRVLNVGTIAHPVHYHGYHGKVVSVDNVHQTRVMLKDVMDIGPMQTQDFLFYIDQRGLYIIHDHTGMMVTQDGVYPEGMLSMFDACKNTGGTTYDDYCSPLTIGVDNKGASTDKNEPVISSVRVENVAAAGADIVWQTDESSDSGVELGTSPGVFDTNTVWWPDMTNNHKQCIGGLKPSTKYYYRVRSRDQNGNLAISPVSTFTTPSLGADKTPPTISSITVKNLISTGAVITWKTNESAKGHVYLGASTKLGNERCKFSLATTHAHDYRKELLPGTTYYFQVYAKDPSGNPTTSAMSSFTTPTGTTSSDSTAPSISKVAASSITSTGAKITWTTDEKSDSVVEYGTTTAYGTESEYIDTLVTSHSSTLSGLKAATRYNYRVKSSDAAGNLAVSGNYTFTTTQ